MFLWLDPDKRVEAFKQASRARNQGVVVMALFSDKDPKELTDGEIKKTIGM